MKKHLSLLPFLFLPLLAGCPDGGAEEVGEDIDEAVDDAAEAVDDAVDEVKDTETESKS
jgi:hypothetical protein